MPIFTKMPCKLLLYLSSVLCTALSEWKPLQKHQGNRVLTHTRRTLVRAPLGFFTKTDTGVVTNLFSQDLNLADTELPTGLLDTIFNVSLLYLDHELGLLRNIAALVLIP